MGRAGDDTSFRRRNRSEFFAHAVVLGEIMQSCSLFARGAFVIYPAANPSVKLAVTSSTTDYNHKMPPLGPRSTKVLFYLADRDERRDVVLPERPRRGLGEASADGITLHLKSCYTLATKGKYGGEIGGVGSLLKDKSIPVAAGAFIEIYPGKLASGKC
jgi:hypothetical protein